ncbi:MAG TPA: TlpA disulfide reductase family protein, partial [Saprospiraceae bacterium]|nr:TlpA disulfide reductase family protein [Saprospiraceae bacterium]
EAPWVSEEQLNKMMKNSKTLKPILLGKIAPDIELTTRAGDKLSLHDLKSNFTVLYFWDPDCGHCKKSIPKVVEFYEKFKDRGVEVLAVCTKLTDKVPECWEAVDDRGMDIWINAADPYLRSRYKQLYDIRSTPMIYILDENKEILSKKISSSQLEEVLTKLIQMKAENKL